ncbi:phosphatase PAP2 family protein [Nocardioides sp. AX2bis]|uniref:phosphatase PAP2 family protein n=1 Tax=Nocardioides sp. AX2bis TaxID=2653157 RepID=UPI0012F13CED|nr:phosphatase PAP2 family protein [Nocardioides sp. AX2bis]VXB39064.1 Inositol phosphorylceramide synthase [Nocardioides sp. AX2bis]
MTLEAPRSPPTDPPRPAGRGWLVAFWALVATFVLVTLVRSAQVGVPLRDPGGAWFAARIASSTVVFAVLALADAHHRTERGHRDLRGTLATLRGRWSPRRLVLAATGVTGYYVVYACYRNLKSWVAFQEPQDGTLLAWDRWLFLGHSPAGLLHDLLGVQVSAYVLVAVYESFSTLIRVAVVAAVVLPERVREGYVLLSSAAWVWILGVCSYYLVPSLGPFSSEPAQFADLPDTVVTETQRRFLAERADFLADPGAPGALSQVAAFGSLHVAVTCMLLLMAYHYGLRRTRRVMVAFVLTTMVATVYLGWHFAVDDVAGVLIAVVAVLLGRATTGKPVTPGRGRASPSSSRRRRRGPRRSR